MVKTTDTNVKIYNVLVQLYNERKQQINDCADDYEFIVIKRDLRKLKRKIEMYNLLLKYYFTQQKIKML